MSGFAIVAASDYLHAVAEGESLPSLDLRVQQYCRDRFRRIDRFILLAILGSAECSAKAKLREDCGVYLSSGVGPVGSNAQVQEQLCRDHLLPKPFHFVNTLGSAAGHHVAKNLGLRGQTLFISRRGEAFASALEVATADLELGIVGQALVGAVEECALPLADHRRRLGLPCEAKVAEGSHWILLEAGPRTGCPTLRLEHDGAEFSEPCIDRELAFHDSLEAARLSRWLVRRDTPRFAAGRIRVE